MKAGKKILSLLAVLALLLSLSVTGFAAMPDSINNVNDAMNFIGSGGVVTVRKGTLYNDSTNKGIVYVVGIVGSNTSVKNPDNNNFGSCILASASIPSLYFNQVKTDILNKVPAGSKVVLVGHSLGGMVAQQIAADSQIKSKYQILNTLTLGSPYILTGSREGSLHRMYDRADVVPVLSIACIANFWAGNVEYESGGYYGSDAHNKSYRYSSCWQKYDAFGVKNGNTKIVLN